MTIELQEVSLFKGLEGTSDTYVMTVLPTPASNNFELAQRLRKRNIPPTFAVAPEKRYTAVAPFKVLSVIQEPLPGPRTSGVKDRTG